MRILDRYLIILITIKKIVKLNKIIIDLILFSIEFEISIGLKKKLFS